MSRILTTLLLCILIQGCGTLTTLINPDERVSWRLERSHCNQIPYLYSGVVYNFCTVYGEAETDSDGVPVSQGPGPFLIVGLDTALCLVTDTVALPYTLYRYSHNDYIIVD